MNVKPGMKLKYKLMPCNKYDIGALERWLERCASQGLFVEELFPLHAVFSWGEPRRRRYSTAATPTWRYTWTSCAPCSAYKQGTLPTRSKCLVFYA